MPCSGLAAAAQKDATQHPLSAVPNPQPTPGITRDTLMMRMKPEQWEDVISTNLSSVFYATQVGGPGAVA
jgi:NAD(P)-dependent dehydrogenase (short-subunit alcohol dehydrogenase family)